MPNIGDHVYVTQVVQKDGETYDHTSPAVVTAVAPTDEDTYGAGRNIVTLSVFNLDGTVSAVELDHGDSGKTTEANGGGYWSGSLEAQPTEPPPGE